MRKHLQTMYLTKEYINSIFSFEKIYIYKSIRKGYSKFFK